MINVSKVNKNAKSVYLDALKDWNSHASDLVIGMSELEDHALYSLWIRGKLIELLNLYNFISGVYRVIEDDTRGKS